MAKRAKAAFDPKVFLATVNHGRKISRFRKGAVVFQQATRADAVCYVHKGRIKIVVSSSDGREAVIALLGPGEFFGEGCLIGQPLRLATAKAVVDSEVMRVAKTEMLRVLHAEPTFAELLSTSCSTPAKSAWLEHSSFWPISARRAGHRRSRRRSARKRWRRSSVRPAPALTSS
jgi:CRP-like cAMP-binding protein